MDRLKASPLYDIALGTMAVCLGLIVVMAEIVGASVLAVKLAGWVS